MKKRRPIKRRPSAPRRKTGARRSSARRNDSARLPTEKKLRAVISHAPVILFTLDSKGVVTLSEGQGLKALGFRPGETVGRSAFDLYRDIPQVAQDLRRALAGETFSARTRLGGTVLQTKFSPIKSADRVTGVLGVCVDITERERAETLAGHQAAALRASMDGLAILDEAERYLYINEAHAQIYGYAGAKELQNKSWKSLYAADDLKRFETEIMPAFAKHGSWRGEAVGKRKDGSLFPQEVSLTAIPGGGLVCAVRDITEQKCAEAEHARLLDLERQARGAAEAASRAKDEFLAVVSHELRTPMTAILGWTWLLRSGELADAEAAKALDVIERNMKMQSQIIEDLLDVSTIVTGKLRLDLRPVTLGRVLEAVLETVRPQAEARGMRLESVIEQDASVSGDPRRLQQVLWNLLANAVKYGREGGTARMRLGLKGARAQILVEDDGEGIHPDFLPLVFDPFLQGESSLTRTHRGLGIGLAIVRQLVEMHGGTVAANSPGPGKGSVFAVTLPLAAAPAAAASGAPAPAGTFEGLRALVVDDVEDHALIVAQILKKQGCAVATAATAAEALAAVVRDKPDILICDLSMPDRDGLSLIREIRALGRSRGGSVKALALTARGRAQDRAQALEAGFHMYLAKPFESGKLLELVRRLVQNA